MFENTGATIPIVPQITKRAAKENDHLLRLKEEKVDNENKGKGNSWVDNQPSAKNAFNASGILLDHLVVSTPLLDNRYFVGK